MSRARGDLLDRLVGRPAAVGDSRPPTQLAREIAEAENELSVQRVARRRLAEKCRALSEAVADLRRDLRHERQRRRAAERALERVEAERNRAIAEAIASGAPWWGGGA